MGDTLIADRQMLVALALTSVIPVALLGCAGATISTSTEQQRSTLETTAPHPAGLDVNSDTCAAFNQSDSSTTEAFFQTYSFDNKGRGLMIIGCGAHPATTLKVMVDDAVYGGMASYP